VGGLRPGLEHDGRHAAFENMRGRREADGPSPDDRHNFLIHPAISHPSRIIE
jgi:hypothetical protein